MTNSDFGSSHGPESGSGSAGPHQDDARTPAPRPVRIARWVWIAATLVGLVRSFVQLSDRQALTASLQAQVPQWSQEQVDAATNSTIALTLAMSALVVVVYVVLANRMQRGRNWCRVVLAVVGVLEAAGTLLTLLVISLLGMATVGEIAGVALGGSDIAFGIVIAIVDIAALVLMFLPESNQYFRDIARQRRFAPPAPPSDPSAFG